MYWEFYIAFSVPSGHIAVKEYTFLLQRLGSYLSSCFVLCLPLSSKTMMAVSNSIYMIMDLPVEMLNVAIASEGAEELGMGLAIFKVYR